MDKKKPIVLEYQRILNDQIGALHQVVVSLATFPFLNVIDNSQDVAKIAFANDPTDIDADTIKTLVDTQLKLMRAVLSSEGVDIPLEYPEGTFEDDVKQVETAEERKGREEEKGFYS